MIYKSIVRFFRLASFKFKKELIKGNIKENINYLILLIIFTILSSIYLYMQQSQKGNQLDEKILADHIEQDYIRNNNIQNNRLLFKKCLSNREYGVCNEAINKLSKSILNEETIPDEEMILGLIELLVDENFFIRDDALHLLTYFELTKSAIPAIINRLDNKSLAQEQSIELLGSLDAKEAIPKIILYLTANDVTTRGRAIKALRELEAREAIPRIIENLRDTDDYVREEAIETLMKFQATEAILEITNRLNDKNSCVRETAIKALGHLNASKAIPQIINRLEDEQHDVRYEAIEALVKFQAKQAIPKIIERLDDTDNDVHSRECIRLRHVRDSKKKIFYVRLAAIRALGQLKAKEAIPSIKEKLKDNHEYVAETALQALKEINDSESPKSSQ